MVPRLLGPRLKTLARSFSAITVTGPRQSGKTTLCRATFPDADYVSLEAPDIREYAIRDPRGFLAEHPGLTILDEVQRAPALLSYVQEAIDAGPKRLRFVLTGSANFALLEGIPQSLAGRTAVTTLLPLGLDELRGFGRDLDDPWDAVWRGSYPAIHDRRAAPPEWYSSYVATYVERDLRQFLKVGDLATFQTFLRLCAGRSAQLLNLSALGGDAGVVHGTVRAWISVLEASYLVHRLQPYATNLDVRLVKSPKLHFVDTGMLCFLLGIRTATQLRDHPLRGGIFETWVVSEIMKARVHRGETAGLSFTRTPRGAEVDCVVERGDGLLAVEVKSAATVAADFFRGVDALAKLLARKRRPPRIQPVVVYAGARRESSSRGTVLPWNAIDALDWAGR